MSARDPLSVAASPDPATAVEGSSLEMPAVRLRGSRVFLAGVLRSRNGRVGLGLLVLIALIAVLGPVLRPHDPTAVIGAPFEAAGASGLLGTDQLGRDVLSRFLSGAGEIVVVAFGATIAAYLFAITLGLIAGYRRGVADTATIGVLDVLLSIPPIILALMIVAALGGGTFILAGAVMVVQIPPATRLVRSFTMNVVTSEYVAAAVARGERRSSILSREILPNIRVPALADFGIRLSWSVMLFASLCFLGFGPSPPAANWGVMVSENRAGLLVQPLPVLVPALGIAALVLGINLTADSFARAIGRGRVGGIRA
jgi:ABC-type dipeptide/oligopeptide/nickel transport system permease subunit